MEENNNNKTILIIAGIIVLSMVIIVVLFKTTRQSATRNQQTNNQTKVTQTVREERTTPPYFLTNGNSELTLYPNKVQATVNNSFEFALNLSDLPGELIAADIILEFDPETLEFVGINNVNSNLVNGRALIQDKQLILSFVKQIKTTATSSANNTDSTINLGTVVFKAKKAGTTKIKPVINASAKSSLVMIKDKTNNQLSKINDVTVTIK